MKLFAIVAIAALYFAASSAQPASAQYSTQYSSANLPDGSWQDSCRNSRMRGATLTAQCRADDDSWVRSSLDTSQCQNGQVSNHNGSLTCERGSQYYRGNNSNRNNNNNARQNQTPSGSWSDSCSNGQMRGSVLMASCRNDRGDYRQTSIDVQQCRYSNVANRNGSLVCQNGQQ